MNKVERRYLPTSNEYLAARLYKEIGILTENNLNGRYDEAILNKKKKLNSLLSKITQTQKTSAVAGI